MRDIILFAALLAMVPFLFAGPEIAAMLWAWATFFSPNFYLYGIASQVSFTEIFAILTFILILFSSRRKIPPVSPIMILFCIFGVHSTLSMLLSPADPEIVQRTWEFLIKELALALVLLTLFDTKLRVHAFVLIILIALGYHGSLEALKFLVTGGGHRIVGPQNSMIRDNNHFALAMLMILPLAVFVMRTSQEMLVRVSAQLLAAFLVIAVIGTFSRGGALGLLAVAGWIVMRSDKKFIAVAAVAIVGVFVLLLAPDAWFARVETIQTADQDNSFMTRIIAWKISVLAALDNPIFGVGMHGIQDKAIWQQYALSFQKLSFIPSPLPNMEKARAAHSIYFEVLGDMGFVGLTIFLAILYHAWRNCSFVLKVTRGDRTQKWTYELANALQLSLVAFIVAGAALSFAYLDIVYVIIAMTVLVKQIAIRENPGLAAQYSGDKSPNRIQPHKVRRRGQSNHS